MRPFASRPAFSRRLASGRLAELRFALPAAIGCATLLASVPARADNEANAKDLFARGRELRANNDCGSAVPLFRKAYSIYPSGLGSLRNVAECEEALGHFASARRAWLDVKRALITMPPDAKYDGWDKDAEEAATRLKPKVATFIVDVYVKSPQGEALANEKSGVEVFVNGESVGTALVGTPLERDPGSYRIRSQVRDAQAVEQEVTLSAGDNPHVTMRLVQTPHEAATTVASDPGKGRRTIGWVLTGVGGAALIAGGATFLLRSSAKSDLDDKCPTHEACDPSLRDTVDRGKTMSTLTTILVPAGIVAAGVGLTLVLTSRSNSSTATASSLTVSPWAGGASATLRF